NAVLREWLAPRDLHDICFVVGHNAAGLRTIVSEISPDCMRLKSPEGASLDKDLFRQGKPGDEILEVWRTLVSDLRAATADLHDRTLAPAAQ
ncbi:MAG TPA: hypothetical protein VKQ70_04195, partial [Caulobacteraceae bacterium]|nr:hypothetical protein [Caulobacteraceae bacterium]